VERVRKTLSTISKERMKMENILLKEALGYADRNWAVFPCRVRPSKPFLTKKGKEVILPPKSPLCKGGLNGATLDKNQIKEWWTKFPHAAIGVNCGLSNLVVVDIDKHKESVNGLENWLNLNVSDAGALHAQTPSGGLHVVYSGSTSSYGDELRGIDVRSRGAYFIVPPSYVYMKNGKSGKYKMLDDWSREPIEIPSDLVEKLNILRGKDKKENKRKTVITESLDKQVIKAKTALENLPPEYYTEYFKWLSVGIALKNSLGDAGFALWDNWSQQSEKYDPDNIQYKWENMKPREITLGSLIYWSKQNGG
jgi:hypothetical protein